MPDHEINEDALETVDANDFWRAWKCVPCGVKIRHLLMLRDIPRCEKCGREMETEGFKIK